eukprot:220699-Pelagomonas_calceolata.AAC.1
MLNAVARKPILEPVRHIFPPPVRAQRLDSTLAGVAPSQELIGDGFICLPLCGNGHDAAVPGVVV